MSSIVEESEEDEESSDNNNKDFFDPDALDAHERYDNLYHKELKVVEEVEVQNTVNEYQSGHGLLVNNQAVYLDEEKSSQLSNEKIIRVDDKIPRQVIVDAAVQDSDHSSQGAYGEAYLNRALTKISNMKVPSRDDLKSIRRVQSSNLMKSDPIVAHKPKNKRDNKDDKELPSNNPQISRQMTQEFQTNHKHQVRKMKT